MSELIPKSNEGITRRERRAVRGHRAVERTDAIERLAEGVLNVGVPRREGRRFPQERQRGGVIRLVLQVDRLPINRPRASVLRLSCRRGNRGETNHHEKNERRG